MPTPVDHDDSPTSREGVTMITWATRRKSHQLMTAGEERNPLANQLSIRCYEAVLALIDIDEEETVLFPQPHDPRQAPQEATPWVLDRYVAPGAKYGVCNSRGIPRQPVLSLLRNNRTVSSG